MINHQAIAHTLVSQIIEHDTWVDFNKLVKYCSVEDLEQIYQNLLKTSERLIIILNRMEQRRF